MLLNFFKRTLCGLAFAVSASAFAATDYQDWWWNQDQSGMGINVGHQGDTIVVSWYHYDSDRSPSFLLFAGKLVNGAVTGELVRSTGPQPGASYNASQVQRATVGTATIRFQTDSSATLSYNYSGLSGDINLARYSFSAPKLSGNWDYAVSSSVRQCSNPANNEDNFSRGRFYAQLSGSNMTIQLENGCSINASFNQAGVIASGNGRTSCSGGAEVANLEYKNLRVSGDFLTMEFTRRLDGETCVETGAFIARRR